jgi:hypothetical protein
MEAALLAQALRLDAACAALFLAVATAALCTLANLPGTLSKMLFLN